MRLRDTIRMTIEVPIDVWLRGKKFAAERGVSFEDLVGQGIQDMVEAIDVDAGQEDTEVGDRETKLTLDLALVRWSVECRHWQEHASGHQPDLGAFLAGWFSEGLFDKRPEPDRDSFRAGQREAFSATHWFNAHKGGVDAAHEDEDVDVGTAHEDEDIEDEPQHCACGCGCGAELADPVDEFERCDRCELCSEACPP